MSFKHLFILLSMTVPTALLHAAVVFDIQGRFRLAEARVKGERVVVLVIAARAGATERVANAVRDLGGTIDRCEDRVAYLRVTVPIEQAETAINLPDVEVAEINEPHSVPFRSASYFPTTRAPAAPDPAAAIRPAAEDPAIGKKLEQVWLPIPSDYPFRHPYSPLGDLNAEAWRRDHPTWDGRGVTIASIEGGVPDLLLPELQEGLTLDGRPVRKFVELRNYSAAPSGQVLSDFWIKMDATVQVSDQQVTIGGIKHWAPRPGQYQAGVYDMEAVSWGEMGEGFNPNRWGKDTPNPEGYKIGVLWDEQTNTVWVDTDQDRDFSDEKPLTDYAEKGDVGILGKDDPATAIRESIAFVVRTDSASRQVAISPGYFAHQTGSVGAAAARRGSHGWLDGVAPGARIFISGAAPWFRSEYIENYIVTFLDERVDVLSCSQSTMDNGLRNGSAVSAVILARLIDLTGKVIVQSGGNGSAFAQCGISDPGARGVLAIGAYQNAASYALSQQFVPAQMDNLHGVSTGGPGGGGAIKPDLLAPAGHLSLAPASRPERYMVNTRSRLSPGYQMYGGTSQAAPVASGAIALLVSAAKQSKIPYDAERMRSALYRGARYIDSIPAFHQGHGLIQVSAAWEKLTRYATQWNPLNIEVRAPVHSGMSRHLSPANTGIGLLEMNWRNGESGTRTISFRRTTGSASPLRYGVRWLGNAGTFRTSESITLPLNQWTDLVVNIHASAPGAHSAILELVNPPEDDAVHRYSCAIAVSEPFRPDHTAEIKVELARPSHHSRFIDVPPGTGALKLEFSSPLPGWFLMELLTPQSRGLGANEINLTGRTRELPVRGKNTAVTRIIYDPEPGVWNLCLNGAASEGYDPAHPTQPRPPLPLTIKATLIGANVQADSERVTVRSSLAAFEGGIVSSLASGRRDSTLLRPREQRVYNVAIPEGTVALAAKLRILGASAGEAHVFVFDCNDPQNPTAFTDRERVRWGAEKSVWVPKPRAGTWKIVIDAAEAPPEGIAIEYTDVVINPQLGSVSTTDFIRPRAVGTEWSSAISVWRAADLPADREPFAVFSIQDLFSNFGGDSVIYGGPAQPIAWTARRL